MSPAMWASAPRRSLRAQGIWRRISRSEPRRSRRVPDACERYVAAGGDRRTSRRGGRITSGVTSRFDEVSDLTQKMERIPIWARSRGACRGSRGYHHVCHGRGGCSALVTLASVRDGIKGLDVWREYRSRAEGDGKRRAHARTGEGSPSHDRETPSCLRQKWWKGDSGGHPVAARALGRRCLWQRPNRRV